MITKAKLVSNYYKLSLDVVIRELFFMLENNLWGDLAVFHEKLFNYGHDINDISEKDRTIHQLISCFYFQNFNMHSIDFYNGNARRLPRDLFCLFEAIGLENLASKLGPKVYFYFYCFFYFVHDKRTPEHISNKFSVLDRAEILSELTLYQPFFLAKEISDMKTKPNFCAYNFIPEDEFFLILDSDKI
jgi:hypothetical protein